MKLGSLLTFVTFTLMVLNRCNASNILLLLCDDLDLHSSNSEALQRSRSWIADEGATFMNAFTTIPICCPSRASIMSGRYVHNHNVLNITQSGGCGDRKWIEGLEAEATFAKLIHDTGRYKTAHIGKYSNGYDDATYIPPGWDDWNTKATDYYYYNYSLSANGVLEMHGDDYDKDYSTNLFMNKTMNFLQSLEPDAQFMAVVSFDAPHFDYDSAPKYEEMYQSYRAPRTPDFNYVEPASHRKHWLISGLPRPLSQNAVDQVDEVYRKRLRTLLSVDDAIDSIMSHLEARNMLDDTFVIFSSDHGYHFGNHGMPAAKFLPLDTDIRIPLWIRGPGINPGRIINDLAVTIDFAPTFLDFAGALVPEDMDGISLLPLLQTLEAPPSMRSSFLVQYYGMDIMGDSSYWDIGNRDECPDMYVGNDVWGCLDKWDCHCMDSPNNTYSCVRTLSDAKK